jgi:hypothetical protein
MTDGRRQMVLPVLALAPSLRCEQFARSSFHLSFVICHLSSVICHALLGYRLLAIGYARFALAIRATICSILSRHGHLYL